ncbi:DUF882 domain-containing protein [Neomegalonema sp.]|uniref:DUF882 domain-containing protein n=1 Tax=Neomegalonema sp. TaxID=2039713 RepID=UPI0026232949|nr:DUF882 domain-containing protein [Neomegalonema sp.]MDD2867158.1 DUF882 domain-containing protein [Neomegalonema sp.]
MTQSGKPEAQKPTRRGFLLTAMGLAAAGAAAGAGLGMGGTARAAMAPFDPMARAAALAPRTLDLVAVNTGERFSGVYYQGGFYDPGAVESLDLLLRDHRENAALMMDVRLFDFLAEIQGRIGGKQIQITSGYRTPRTNARLSQGSERVAKNSLHMQGMAVDLKTPGVKISDVQKIAHGLRRGGVGSYAGASFLHVDVGATRDWRY